MCRALQTIAPLWQSLTVSGSFATADGSTTIAGTTKSYTYSSSDELEAGYKISIEGIYTEAVGIALTVTIEGATWRGERTNTSGTFRLTADPDWDSVNGYTF